MKHRRHRLNSKSKRQAKKPITVADAGRKGGFARNRYLTRERIIEIARKAQKASVAARKQKECHTP